MGRGRDEWERTFDAVPDLIFILDADHRILRANRAAAERLGRAPGDLVGRRCCEVVHGTPEPPEFCPHVRLLADGREHRVEFLHERLGITFLVTVTPVTGEPDEPIRAVHVARDISDLKRAEQDLARAHEELEKRVRQRTEELRRAELKYRTVANVAYDWEYWKSPDWSLHHVSPSCQRVTGYPPEAFYENPRLIREIIVPEDRDLWEAHYRAHHKGRRAGHAEFRIRRRDGTIAWIEHGCEPVIDEAGEFLGTRASNRDVTARKQARRNLAASESLLRTVLASLPDHVAVINREGRILSVNEAWLDFARRNDLRSLEQGLPGADYLAVCRRATDEGSPDAAAALAGIADVLAGRRERFAMEYECSSPEQQRWFAMTVMPLRRPQGGAVISHSDITRRRLAEAQLRRQQESLAEAQRVAHLGNWDWNIVTNELMWSDEAYRIFGLAPQQFGATYEAFLERVHPDDREAVQTAVNLSLADPAMAYSIEHRVVRPDGTERVVHERGEVTFDDRVRPARMIGTVHDVTERHTAETEARRLRAELAHLDRVGTIGVLTAALAHEVNQPLAAILGNAQAALRLLAAEPPDLDEVAAALHDIVADDKRAAEVIRRLRAMLKRDEATREAFDLNEVVREVVDLVHSEFVLRQVSCETAPAASLPRVIGDRVQVQQVLLNLLMNALDAVSRGPSDRREVRVSTRAVGGREVVATVADTGPGVAPGESEAIFEAFHSDKQQGIGLGLALCQAIVAAHGGRIWVDDAPDGGAAFSFTLPCSGRGPDAEGAR